MQRVWLLHPLPPHAEVETQAAKCTVLGGVLLLLIGSLVASLAGDYTLLAISLGGPASAFVFRNVLDLPDRL